MKNIEDLHVAIAQPRTVRLLRNTGDKVSQVSPEHSNHPFQDPLAV